MCVCLSVCFFFLVRNRLQNHAHYGDEAFAGDSVGLGLGQRLDFIFKKGNFGAKSPLTSKIMFLLWFYLLLHSKSKTSLVTSLLTCMTTLQEATSRVSKPFRQLPIIATVDIAITSIGDYRNRSQTSLAHYEQRVCCTMEIKMNQIRFWFITVAKDNEPVAPT